MEAMIRDKLIEKENALVFFTTPSGKRLEFQVFKDSKGIFP